MIKNTKNGKIFKIIILLSVIVCILTVGVVIYINMLFSNMLHEDINKSDLAVNFDLYDEVKDNITKNEFDKVVNVALFGTDSRDIENMEAGRADTIMIASVNQAKKSIKLISIPRDTYVEVPEYGKTKINHSYAYGKEQLTIKTINKNFGLNITDYATIDFSGLIHIINDIGGVEVEITNEEKNYINNRSKEAYDISKNEYKKVTSIGKVNLTGEQALTHSRNRTIGNDFTRASRQRDVLEALLLKLSSIGVESILSLSDDFLKEVKTNINVNEYIPLLISVLINKNEYIGNINSKQIPEVKYSKDKMIKGVYYFIPDMDLAKQDFYETLYEM